MDKSIGVAEVTNSVVVVVVRALVRGVGDRRRYQRSECQRGDDQHAGRVGTDPP
jgi:hypothetical protein